MNRYHLIAGAPYPTTVTRARYGGTYSGASWHAWPLEPQQVPLDATGSDVACATFWDDYSEPVGLGNTPNEAVEDLTQQLKEILSTRDLT